MKYLNDPKSVTQKKLDDNRKSAVDAFDILRLRSHGYLGDLSDFARNKLCASNWAIDAASHACKDYADDSSSYAMAANNAVTSYFEITKENRADYENKILESGREQHIERLTRICRNSGYHCSDAFAGFLYDNGFRVD